ncbi:AzlD domain-containing protein [Streptomyces sp. NPDC001793]|uniref:AzlD domain-containing protein n=1 Tax=Streptomyces sp. NPDC001793 TaxID=3154657 RepID=UPI00332C65B6
MPDTPYLVAAVALSATVTWGLRALPFAALAPLAALAVTVGLHLWRRNALLSILGGTTVHVVLASTVFAH